MRKLRGALSYSNVVATAALFLALTGGVAYAASTMGKGSVTATTLATNAVTSRSIAKHAVKSNKLAANAVQSKNLGKNAVKSKSLAANAVTGAKIKKEAITASKVKKATITGSNVKPATLTRANLATGTLAGLQVAEVTSASVPGLSTATETGTPIPLTGNATFTPQAGKSYELLTELKGTPITQIGPEGENFCFTEVVMFANGASLGSVYISASPTQPAPFNVDPTGTLATAVGLQQTGQPVTLSAGTFGSTGCSAATTGSLRAVVVELG